MLIRSASIATLVGAPYSVPLSLPILVAAVLVVGALLTLVFMALRSKDNVQAGLQLRPWSITFSLDARNGAREPPREPEGLLAPKDKEFSSKP